MSLLRYQYQRHRTHNLRRTAMSKTTINDASVLRIVETRDDKEVDITPESAPVPTPKAQKKEK